MNTDNANTAIHITPLPCPFCLEDEFIITIKEDHGCAAYCTVCFAQGPGASTETGALVLWNRRGGEY